MISVIIPLYNKEKSISYTVQSVLNQTYRDIELIIVNDGSTDDSLSAVKSITDDRIVIINKPNGGVSSARNEGIMYAKNEYIAFIDGDDIWHPKHLQILNSSMSQLDNDEIGGAGTCFFKSSTRQFDESKFKENKPVIIQDYFDFMTAQTSTFYTSSVLVKKSKLMKTGLFDENLRFGEDIECWYKLFSSYKLIFSNTVTVLYFVAAENRSTHYATSLDDRFHLFKYKNKSASEKKYLDNLVLIIMADCFRQKAYRQLFIILKMYFYRLFGIINVLLQISAQKLITYVSRLKKK